MTDFTDGVPSKPYLALSGGVGGAKLVLGLSKCLSPDDLLVVTNTGDDFEHLGLTICPDLDTVLYTLADWNNKDLGWGQAQESWNFLAALKRLGGEDWFNLGDRDMATHIVRSRMLFNGASLSDVVARLSENMGISHRVVPMTDHPVRTMVHTSHETLSFQHYFVRDRCEPTVTGFEFEGIESALPSKGFQQALDESPRAILICPSNPFVSVDPILTLPGVIDAIRAANVPVVVVSNIVGGQALKGPAAKMMSELNMPQTALGVARHYADKYGDLVTGFILDNKDSDLEADVAALGFATIVTNTVMVTLDDKIELAKSMLAFVSMLGKNGLGKNGLGENGLEEAELESKQPENKPLDNTRLQD
ncbi:MAG: LPPG:FO 2-phospho-L-lactate transferase [Candidatus Azotimanducaceae bacterium]|jgi:LPPG:FO 2-phospho-L-lactate transferase